jgi:hypothetical protein
MLVVTTSTLAEAVTPKIDMSLLDACVHHERSVCSCDN